MNLLIKCGTCEVEKEPEEFHKCSSNKKTGRQWHCKECSSSIAKKYYKTRRDVVRKSTLKNTFGITLEEYDEMLLKQNGVCAICGGGQVTGKTNLAVDHCHHTGKVRGLLCNRCNTGIGNLQDDPVVVERALLYLREYGGNL